MVEQLKLFGKSNPKTVVLIVFMVLALVGNYMMYGKCQEIEDVQVELEKEERLVNNEKTRSETSLIDKQTAVDDEIAKLQMAKDERETRIDELLPIVSSMEKFTFESDFPTVKLSKYIANAEEKTGGKIEVVGGSVLGSEPVRSNSYPAQRIDMTVSGSMDEIIDFIKYLEQGSYSNLKVENVDIFYVPDEWIYRSQFTVVYVLS